MKEEQKDILDYLTDSNAIAIAQNIVDIFERNANKDTVDYEFIIGKGTGQLKNREPNTTFIFDSEPDTLLEEFKKALFVRVIEDSDMDKVIVFCQKVSSVISDEHKHRLRDVIRRTVMPDSTPETIPMEDISVREIEISDASPVPIFARSTIKIAKDPGSGARFGTEAVIKRLSDLQEEESPDLTANEVFAKHKDDPVFEGILDIKQGTRFLYDATLKIFADYAFKAPQSPDTPELKLVS